MSGILTPTVETILKELCKFVESSQKFYREVGQNLVPDADFRRKRQTDVHPTI